MSKLKTDHVNCLAVFKVAYLDGSELKILLEFESFTSHVVKGVCNASSSQLYKLHKGSCVP